MSSLKHSRHATVVAYVALFCALTGGAYAAVKLPANSVGSKQVKVNAITSAKVKDGSLAAADFAAGQIPAGERGPAGAAGAAGKDGSAGPTGPRGETGSKGETGAPGKDGKDGIDGANGKDGKDGPTGPKGEQGPRGDTGPTGPGGLTFDNVPRAHADHVYVVDESSPASKAACAGKSAQIPSAPGVETKLAFGTSGGQIAPTHDCTNGYGFVIAKPGVYTVTFNLMWVNNPTGWRAIGLKRTGNGDNGYLGESRVEATNGTETSQTVTATAPFNQGDMIQVYAIQSSGADLGTIADGRTSIEAHFVAPTS